MTSIPDNTGLFPGMAIISNSSLKLIDTVSPQISLDVFNKVYKALAGIVSVTVCTFKISSAFEFLAIMMKKSGRKSLSLDKKSKTSVIPSFATSSFMTSKRRCDVYILLEFVKLNFLMASYIVSLWLERTVAGVIPLALACGLTSLGLTI